MEGDNIGRVYKDFCGYHWRGILTIFLPLVLLPIPILGKSSEYSCAYVIIVMAVYWATECIPIYVSSFIPIIIFPLLGVLDSDVVCKQYINDPIFLFFGGIIIALACEFCNLHKRLALRIILISGCSLRRLHFTVIILTALISMCLNNVATTLMMCPIVGAILEELDVQGLANQFSESTEKDVESKYEPTPNEELPDSNPKYPSNVTIAFYLGVAYAATLGGALTIVGSVTNLGYKEIYEKRFPEATDLLQIYSILAYTAPIIVIEILFVCFYLQMVYMGLFRKSINANQQTTSEEAGNDAKAKIQKKVNEMGPVTIHEWQILILFLLMVLLLFSRDPGWANALQGGIYDSWPMIFVVLALFMIPMNYNFCKYCFGSAPFTTKPTPSLISWKVVHTKLPWGLLFLIGAGFSLAEAITQSKLAEKLANELKEAETWPLLVVQLICIVITIAVTNLCSNVAVCNVLVSIYAELARVCKVHPLNLILPAGVACSMAFLLPVSTPPNAIISIYSHIKRKHMLVAGIGPTIIGILLLLILCASWHIIIFPTSNTFPDWAQPKPDPPTS